MFVRHTHVSIHVCSLVCLRVCVSVTKFERCCDLQKCRFENGKIINSVLSHKYSNVLKGYDIRLIILLQYSSFTNLNFCGQCLKDVPKPLKRFITRVFILGMKNEYIVRLITLTVSHISLHIMDVSTLF